ncbi:MAG: ribonuclease HII [Dehalococcoidia bacterium]|nr:ribonuclease HII [Dehalococcoidia bacterium]
MSTRKHDTKPNFYEEFRFQADGYRLIAGVDEAGRGCLAGPVVAAAVILPNNPDYLWLQDVRDSKILTAKQRERLFLNIVQIALAIGIGTVSHEDVDSIGIVPASQLAMTQAVVQLSPAADSLLIDYLKLDAITLPQKSITHGDALCYSIACASIVAKITRDRMMQELDVQYPGYGLCRNKGYGTREHWHSIEEKGLLPIHRRSFCHLQYRLKPTMANVE